MKKVLLTVFAAAAVTTANAQVTDGYYRVENDYIQQCIYFKSKTPQDIDYAKGEYPLDNIRGCVNQERLKSLYSSVLKITVLDVKGGGAAYEIDMEGQGVSAKTIAGNAKFYIEKADDDLFYATATATVNGVAAQKYLTASKTRDEDTYEWLDGVVKTGKISDSGSKWRLKRVDEADNFIGVAPRLEHNGAYYDALAVYFPVHFVSSDIKVYAINTIKKLSDGKAYAIYKEVTSDLPVGTPVILKCASANPSDNEMQLNGIAPEAITTPNVLRAAYRSCEETKIVDKVDNTATVRMLGVTSEGKLGFVYNSTASVLPVNTAYLEVPSDFPNELTLVTSEEYNEITAGIDGVTINDAAASAKKRGVYNVAGQKVADTNDFDSLPSGLYIVDGQQRVK